MDDDDVVGTLLLAGAVAMLWLAAGVVGVMLAAVAP